MKYCKIITNCSDCGNENEIYGPFDTQKEAHDFHNYQKDSIVKMTCSNQSVVKMQI